ncbi:RAMP superfamily CRISPR-associated protein [Candidatus Electrothrix sp.]|uniref:RAMP superfamily CRISPR-associated protein n=1 Tax=Candidatus Electrothrix sp. TaxID=2170559 RepID=UPI0040567135
MKIYKRILVTGTLTCLSDLHIGDGDLALQRERNASPSETEKVSAKRATADPNRAKVIGRISLDGVKQTEEEQKDKEKKENEMEGRYNTVCRDYENRAYIPGSTLRGSLASFLNQQTSFYRKFFGYADEEQGKIPAAREAGLLRVYDACLQDIPETLAKELGFPDLPGFSEDRHTFLRHSVSICPITGTAEKGKLFCYELVPKGSVFTVQFQIESRNKAGKDGAEKLTEKELAQLLALTEQWNTEGVAIGSGVTKGYGRIQWELERVEVLTSEEELRWLVRDSLEPPPMNLLTDAVQFADISALLINADTAPVSFRLDILPDGPFLVNEPEYVQDKSKEKEGEVFPDLEYSRNHRNGEEAHALIPARTLAGAIRGRARRILATIAHQQYSLSEGAAADRAESLVKEFFGSEERRGALRLTEARGKASGHIQHFIGVDRFTGGVNKGANYKVRAAVCEKLSAKGCLIDLRMVPDGDWWKGMLLLVLLDGMDGDMQIGWGKVKGYGRMTFQLEYNGKTFGDRQILLDEIQEVIGTEAAQQWVEALYNRIAARGGQA